MNKLVGALMVCFFCCSSVMADEATSRQEVNIDDSYLTTVNVLKESDAPIQEVNINKSFLVRVVVKVVKNDETKEVQE